MENEKGAQNNQPVNPPEPQPKPSTPPQKPPSSPTPIPPQSPPPPSKPIAPAESAPKENIEVKKTQPENKFSEIEKLKNSISDGKSISSAPPANTTQENNSVPTTNILSSLLSNTKLLIGIVVGIVVIAIAGAGYYFFVYNQGTLDITVSTNPDILTINDQEYTLENNQQLEFKPGSYTLSADKENYHPFTQQFEISAGQTTNLIVDLVPYPSPIELVEFTTNYPHLNPSGNEVSYLSNFGTTFYKINLNTFEKDVISANIFNHILDIQWAPSSRKANIIKSNNNAKIHKYQAENLLYESDLSENATRFHLFDFSKYDLVSQTLTTFPPEVHNPTWHPSKEEIVFHYIDDTTSENTLSKAKPNMDEKEPLTDLPSSFTNALAKYSPDGNLVAIVDTDKTTTAEPNPVYLYDVVPRNFDKIPSKDIYKNILWSPDSTKILAVKLDNTSTIIDAKTFESTAIDIKASADRIAWYNDSNRLIFFPIDPVGDDKMLVYNMSSNSTSSIKITDSLNYQTLSNPTINRNNDTLFFIGDEYLYSLAIQ